MLENKFTILRNLKRYSLTDAIALESNGKQMSYKEFYERIKALTFYLKNNVDDSIIGIYGDKENDMLVCIYSALAAKKRYVMLSSSYPVDRLNLIIKDCEAKLILNTTNKKFGGCLINEFTSEDLDNLLGENSDYEDIDITGYDLDKTAFILYTSGSSGEPKGIEITYRNLLCKIMEPENDTFVYNRTIQSTNMCLSSYSFSASMGYFYFIDTGGKWSAAPSKVLINATSIFEYMKETNSLCTSLPPTLAKKLYAINDFNEKYLDKMEYIYFVGEPVDYETALEMKKRFPKAKLFNGYGSSETTAVGENFEIDNDVFSLKCKFMPVSKSDSKIIYLLDKHHNVISEENTQGEIAFYGNMVSKGYFKNPELTKERYFYVNGKRVFNTRDVGYYKHGYLFIKGRKDNQIKIGGNRIEIEDVENYLEKCDIVNEAAIAISKKNEIDSMTAFVVLKKDYLSMTKAEAFIKIKKDLMRMVESYKIPSKILFVDELPKNTNGKLDRYALNKIVNG